MNTFYHELSISFNWWCLLAPCFLVVMLGMGFYRFSINYKTLKIQRCGRYFGLAIRAFALMLDITVCALIFKESFFGLIQLSANTLVNTEMGWLPFVFGTALVFFALIYFCFLVLAAKIGEWAKLGYLIEIRKQLKAERKLERRKAIHIFRGEILDFPKKNNDDNDDTPES